MFILLWYLFFTLLFLTYISVVCFFHFIAPIYSVAALCSKWWCFPSPADPLYTLIIHFPPLHKPTPFFPSLRYGAHYSCLYDTFSHHVTPVNIYGRRFLKAGNACHFHYWIINNNIIRRNTTPRILLLCTSKLCCVHWTRLALSKLCL